MTVTYAQLGTGTMGLPIAKNLAAAGLTLQVWNRSRDKAEPLAGPDVTVADSPAEAVRGAEVVITMLYDVASVADVIRRAAPAPGTIWVQLSTVGVDGCVQLAELADELGLILVDAPVLGTKKPAEDGKLVILASGPDEARERCTPVFDAIGARTMWLGAAGTGSKLKLVANAWVIAVLEGISESLVLAGALDLDPKLFLEAVAGGAMDAPYVQLKGTGMLAGSWDPAFALSGAAKDAGLILDAASSAGVRMATTEAARDYFQRAITDGHGDLDMSAIYLAHTAETDS